MNPVVSVWTALEPRRRLIAVGAALAMFVAVLALSRTALSPTMGLLYGNLDPVVAGGVVAALEQQGVAYEVKGDAIWVPQSDRDALRLSLAGQGLPSPSTQGYELLDSLSGFGTTSEMFDAAYWRAKEGELARTILANPRIRGARVHISAAASRGFDRPRPPSAAVTVTTGGMPLSPPQVQALRYLVASSVPGLGPEAVSVIDSDAGLIGIDTPARAAGDRAEALRANAQRLLEARVGIGNAVVELSIEEETETENLTERRIDPTSRVAISTDVTENSSTAQGDSGAVTVASNLPTGDAAPDGGSQSQSTEARTLTNYEISESQRSLNRAPGGIRRMTVAVLVNEIAALDANGNPTTSPRSQDELTALTELVAQAVGLDEARGDRISLRALPFEAMPDAGSTALAPAGLDLGEMVRLGVFAAVALILGLFVVRPVLVARRLPAPEAPATRALAMPDHLAAIAAPDTPHEDPDPVARMRQMIEARQTEALRVLQTWVEEPEVKA